jgi:hypothetical protein
MNACPIELHSVAQTIATNVRLDAVNGTQPVSDRAAARCRGESGVAHGGADTRSAVQRAEEQ